MDRYAPTKEKVVRGKPTPWLTIDIKKQMHNRDHFLKRARRTNSEVDWSTYRQLRNAVTYAIRQSKARHCRNLLQESSHKPRDFWKNIKNNFPTKTNSNDLPPMMNFEGKKINDKSTIANTFCIFFSTIWLKASAAGYLAT